MPGWRGTLGVPAQRRLGGLHGAVPRMTPAVPSSQEEREKSEPVEQLRRVSGFLIVLAVLAAGWGGYQIANSGLGSDAQFGDRRTMATLSGPSAAPGGAAAAADGAAIYTARCAACH